MRTDGFRDIEQWWVQDMRAWQAAQRGGDGEADVASVYADAAARLAHRLAGHLRRGDHARAWALGAAAALDGAARDGDLTVAERWIRAHDELNRPTVGFERICFSLGPVDLARAGADRAVGAWAEHPHIRELQSRRPTHRADIARFERCAWAALIQPGTLVAHGAGPISHPHRVLPLPTAAHAAFDERFARHPACLGPGVGVSVQGQHLDAWLLMTVAGLVEGAPMAISAAIFQGAVTRTSTERDDLVAALELVRAMQPALPRWYEVDDIHRVHMDEGYIKDMPVGIPDVDLAATLAGCTHPSPAWALNAPHDALRLGCDACGATSLAVVPIHLAPNADHVPAEQLQRERFYALLRGELPPHALARRGRMSLDVDVALGRDSAVPGSSLIDALFGPDR